MNLAFSSERPTCDDTLAVNNKKQVTNNDFIVV